MGLRRNARDKVSLVRWRAGLPKAIRQALRQVGIFAVVIALFAGGSFGDDQQKAEDGTALSLADLFNMDVYGVSKKKETADESPMSIYVMSRSDMQTWGVRNTFEALGRTPGVSFYNTDVYGQNRVLVNLAGWAKSGGLDMRSNSCHSARLGPIAAFNQFSEKHRSGARSGQA